MSEQLRNDQGQFVSLRDFIITIMDERSRAHIREHVLIDQALASSASLREEAITQARIVVDERLEKLNELRAEVTRDRGQYVTRTEFELQIKPLIRFKDRSLGFGTLVALLSAIAGSVVTTLVLGMFG